MKKTPGGSQSCQFRRLEGQGVGSKDLAAQETEKERMSSEGKESSTNAGGR